MKSLTSLTDLDAKSVLVRIDTDVDVKGTRVVDDSRLRAALPTIRYLTKAGACVTLIGYRGRPKGRVDETLSLRPVAQALAHLLVHGGRSLVQHEKAESPVLATRYRLAKNVELLENSRFDPGEDSNEPEFAALLADGHDYFVNESFATAHRTVASNVGVAKKLPAYAGLRLIDELAHLDLLHSPKRPFTLIVGGAKVEEKLGLLEFLLDKADHVLTGGVTANILLEADGMDIAKSKDDPTFVTPAKKLLEKAHSLAAQGDPDPAILLPIDVIWDDNQRIVDIGPRTIARYKAVIAESETIFWAGSLGVAEMPAYAKGTKAIAEALADHKGVRMIGGGDTAADLKRLGLEKKMSFISVGGGAALEYLAGKKLPGLVALN